MAICFWEEYKKWTEEGRWVELSRPMWENTPHWAGFPDVQRELVFSIEENGDLFTVQKYTMVTQYGTHVDAPCHFVAGKDSLEAFAPQDMVMPLCVMDLEAKCQADNDYAVSVDDILEWEEKYGKVPEGCFFAFHSGWDKLDTNVAMENQDADGQAHYPGWSVDAIKFLVEERNVRAIGHECSDTDPAVIAPTNNYGAEYYILSQDRFQIELMANLEKCPPTGSVIFCTWPKAVGAPGFTARCFALCPKDAPSIEEGACCCEK